MDEIAIKARHSFGASLTQFPPQFHSYHKEHEQISLWMKKKWRLNMIWPKYKKKLYFQGYSYSIYTTRSKQHIQQCSTYMFHFCGSNNDFLTVLNDQHIEKHIILCLSCISSQRFSLLLIGHLISLTWEGNWVNDNVSDKIFEVSR